MKLLVLHTLLTLVAARPGLLRVPKVYNAVITSNQNLSPSRAYPVIQPVIHRTAIGYVPPFYYAQVSPHISGPEVAQFPRGGAPASKEDEVKPALNAEPSKTKDSKVADGTVTEVSDKDKSNSKNDSGKKEEEEQLSFYPNYQSLYYDPYFYTYNGFNPHLVPGTYYFDYQPYGSLEPIPASTPKSAFSERLLPGYHEEGKDSPREGKETEKIPDVPPPPLPTAVPQSS